VDVSALRQRMIEDELAQPCRARAGEPHRFACFDVARL